MSFDEAAPRVEVEIGGTLLVELAEPVRLARLGTQDVSPPRHQQSPAPAATARHGRLGEVEHQLNDAERSR